MNARLRLGRAGTDQRGKGSQGLKLWIERVNYWERDTPQAVYLEHAQANNGGAGNLLIYNHSDTGHSNVANIPAEHLVGGEFVPYIEGDLPAPVDMTVSIVGGGSEPATFIVGESIRQECDSLTLAYAGASGTARGTATGAVSPRCGSSTGIICWSPGTGAQNWTSSGLQTCQGGRAKAVRVPGADGDTAGGRDQHSGNREISLPLESDFCSGWSGIDAV